MSKALTELIRDANRYITPADRHAILDLIEQQAAEIVNLKHDIERNIANHAADLNAVAPAVDAQPVATKEQAHKFAIIRDRNYDGEGLSLWTWDGEYYVGADGDCLSPDPDGTLDGYTAEWLTDYQLEMRLNDASAQSEGLRKDAWQPIETAPKDGTEMLLIATRHSMLMPHPERIVGAYRNGWWSGPSTLSHVTHWMPLPEAPAALSQHKAGEKE